MTKRAVLSLSGGLDSTTLAIHLLSLGYSVTSVSFDYGQKHLVEIEKATELDQYLQEKKFFINHKVIKLDGLSEMLNSALLESGGAIPKGHYEAESMKKTVVPNRNKIFSSIIQAAALSQSVKYDCEVKIALGIHAGDHEIYPDCRQEFRDLDYEAFLSGNWDAERVTYFTPFLKFYKSDIVKLLIKECEKLSLDYTEVLKRTMTAYEPIKIDGVWYSDYKSSSSVERVEAFINLGLTDPIKYADESGVVDWSVVKESVKGVLNS